MYRLGGVLRRHPRLQLAVVVPSCDGDVIGSASSASCALPTYRDLAAQCYPSSLKIVPGRNPLPLPTACDCFVSSGSSLLSPSGVSTKRAVFNCFYPTPVSRVLSQLAVPRIFVFGYVQLPTVASEKSTLTVLSGPSFRAVLVVARILRNRSTAGALRHTHPTLLDGQSSGRLRLLYRPPLVLSCPFEAG